LIAMVVAAFEPEGLLILLFLTALVVPACWASARSGRREPWVRWALVAVEAWWAGAFLLLNALDPGLDWGRVLGPGTLAPLAVVVLLLLPPAGRWFRTVKEVTNQDG
ncbi:MAG: hypothetical protein HOY71_46890, partial [Nonomuraea sp.]|nr:hypothetical protein [Nonomuraea sp.]